MTVRELRKEEWSSLESLFRGQLDSSLPHPGTSVIVVAEEEGQVVGLMVAQLMLHTEPIWVSRICKNSYVIPKLIEKLTEVLPDINYAFATTTQSKVSRLLKRLGFKQQPYTTYRWVRGEK